MKEVSKTEQRSVRNGTMVVKEAKERSKREKGGQNGKMSGKISEK